MKRLQDILGEEQARTFLNLLDRSLWISDVERDRLRAESPAPFLVQSAFGALQEERETLQFLEREQPKQWAYLRDMKAWLEREDKTFNNFPGFPDQLFPSPPQQYTPDVGQLGSPENFPRLFPLPDPAERWATLLDRLDEGSPKEGRSIGDWPLPTLGLSGQDLSRLAGYQEAEWLPILSAVAGSLILDQHRKDQIAVHWPFLDETLRAKIRVYLEGERKHTQELDRRYERILTSERNEAVEKFASLFPSLPGRLRPYSPELFPDAVEESAKTVSTFGLEELPPLSKHIRVPEHSLEFDETRFLTLLASSISLNADEKHRIIEAIGKLSQHQLDDFITTLETEKKRFQSLDEKFETQLRTLEEKNKLEWDSVCRRYISADDSPRPAPPTLHSPLRTEVPTEIVGSFGVQSLPSISKHIEIPAHSLDLDEEHFLVLLAGSISLTADEKHRIIEAIADLSQFQLDELVKILTEEKFKFSQLDKKHEPQLRSLEEKHKIEWASVGRRYLIRGIDKTTARGFFDTVLEIENRFQRFLWDEADLLISGALKLYPHVPFFYEYYLQLRKIKHELQPALLKRVCEDSNQESTLELFKVLSLFLEFEEIYLTGQKTFLAKLDRFRPPLHYSYVKPYLLSKYHLYFARDNQSLETALDYSNEALAQACLDKGEHILCFLSHHHMRVLLAKRDYGGISTMAKEIFGDDLPPYYRLIQHFGTCDRDTTREQCEYALEHYLEGFAENHGLEDLRKAFATEHVTEDEKNDETTATDSTAKDPVEPSGALGLGNILSSNPPADLIPQAGQTGQAARPNLLKVPKPTKDSTWVAVTEIRSIAKELGFIHREDQTFNQRINRLINRNLREQAQAELLPLMEGGLAANNYQKLSAFRHFFKTLDNDELLARYYQQIKQEYETSSDLQSCLKFVALLANMESSFRDEQRSVCDILTSKYYYLAVSHDHYFHTAHYRFREGKEGSLSALHLDIGSACGMHPPLLTLRSLYFRWNDKWQQSIALGLLSGLAFADMHCNAMIAALNSRLNKQALGLFLVDLHRNGSDGNLYNSFGIGFNFHKTGYLSDFIGALFLVESMNLNPSNIAAYLGNRGGAFHDSSVNRQNLSENLHYNALAALHEDHFRIGLSYTYILATSETRGDTATFLSALYTGSDHNCPMITEAHKKQGHEIALNCLTEGYDTEHFPFSIFLARSLMENRAVFIEEHGCLDVEGRAMDFMLNAERVFSRFELSNFFLGDHAEGVYLSLAAEDWYLYLRYPEKTSEEKYAQKLSTLRKLKRGFPIFSPNVDIPSVSRARAIRELVTSLNSGRVISDTQGTIETSIMEAADRFSKFEVLITVHLEEIQRVENDLNHQRKNLVRFLSERLTPVFPTLAGKQQATLLSDMYTAFGGSDESPTYSARLQDIFGHYGLHTAYDDHVAVEADELLFRFARDHRHAQNERAEHTTNIKTELRKFFLSLFQLVRKIHVLDGSEMFESVRKRIRHGWLISHLKDCFTRHDLYMDGDDEDIPPTIRKILQRLSEPRAATEIENALRELKNTFIYIVERLDKEILLLRSDEHREGIFDYADGQFDLDALYDEIQAEHDLTRENQVFYFEAFCDLLDKQTMKCFKHVREFFDSDVFAPLHQKIQDVDRVLIAWEHAFVDAQEAHGRLRAGLSDAEQEFSRNVEIYKRWFDFYEEAVRDFNLGELIEAAERQVWEIDLGKIEEKGLAKARVKIAGDLKKAWLKGPSFPKLLEVFKILFQNVIYHGSFPTNADTPQIEIRLRIQRVQKKGQKIVVEFWSAQDRKVHGIKTLFRELKDESRRARRMLLPNGTGLATIEDILAKRLQGIEGGIREIRWHPRLKKFKVVLELNVVEGGDASAAARTIAQPTKSPGEILAPTRTHEGLRVLIVEDQKLKYYAIRDFLSTLLTGVHTTVVPDIETSCRVLTAEPEHFDVLILDMTLPEDPTIDAPLKSLGGFTVLKVMDLNRIHVPTIVVTQYSNWSAEVRKNTRVFMNQLDAFCSRSYGSFYRGSIRFSHTETEWRHQLKEMIQGLSQGAEPVDEAIEPQDHHKATLGDEEPIDSLTGGTGAGTLKDKILDAELNTIHRKREEAYRNDLMATLGKMAGGMAHELNTPLHAIKLYAQGLLRSMTRRTLPQEEIQADLESICEVVDFMAGQVQSIQSLARGDRLPSQEVDLQRVIRKSFAFFESQLKNSSIQVHLDCHPDLPTIHANESRVSQIFINLIMNARDSLREVEKGPREITVRTTFVRGDHAAITTYFSDTGVGIKPELREVIFEPFFSTKGYKKGMGIGLFNVQDIVLELGGTIRCYDEPGGGVTFVMELPIKEKGISDETLSYSDG
ncbi:MAG: hypothetical protein K0U98_02205 [Deltaproteobacteria bacterium]|nr:hypothetical protein [Deltaproteobacteria bacterium]